MTVKQSRIAFGRGLTVPTLASSHTSHNRTTFAAEYQCGRVSSLVQPLFLHAAAVSCECVMTLESSSVLRIDRSMSMPVTVPLKVPVSSWPKAPGQLDVSSGAKFPSTVQQHQVWRNNEVLTLLAARHVCGSALVTKSGESLCRLSMVHPKEQSAPKVIFTMVRPGYETRA